MIDKHVVSVYFLFFPVVVVLEDFCRVRGEDEIEKKNVDHNLLVKLILENVVFLIKKRGGKLYMMNTLELNKI